MTTKSFITLQRHPDYFPYGQVLLDEESFLLFDQKMNEQLRTLVASYQHLASPNARNLARELRQS